MFRRRSGLTYLSQEIKLFNPDGAERLFVTPCSLPKRGNSDRHATPAGRVLGGIYKQLLRSRITPKAM